MTNLNKAWLAASVEQREQFVTAYKDGLRELMEAVERRAADKTTQALIKIKEMCELAGCECEIHKGVHATWISAKRYRGHHSNVFSSGNHYQVQFSGRGGGSGGVSMWFATAQEAANVLVWENEHSGKRWMKPEDRKIADAQIERSKAKFAEYLKSNS